MIYEKITPTNKWDIRFLEAAKTVASWSPDPSSKVGALAISKQNLPLAWGWNAFPRTYTIDEFNVDKETKYKHVVHAEMNAIYNSSRESICLLDSSFYIYGLPPCLDCAKGLLQVGVKRVISLIYSNITKKWLDSYEESSSILTKAYVKCEAYYET